MSIRLSVFNSTTKASPLHHIVEFGYDCFLLSLEKILEYMNLINIKRVDERERISTRKEVPLFRMDACREAIIDAFLHNSWIGGNAPMFSVYSDRIEIVLHVGKSVVLNEKLFEVL